MILGTLLVRDEEDILEDCIKHHLSNGVDMFIATDNGSVDSTRDILSSFKEVVYIIDELEHNYEQSKWVTRMARKACEYKPDWIVHIDADEFWYGLSFLYKVPSKYFVVLSDFIWEHPPTTGIRNGKFDRRKTPYCYKCLVGKLSHRPYMEIKVSQGNHFVIDHPGEILKLTDMSMTIHHYPARSYERFERKIINGGRAYEKYSGSTGDGFHWRKLYIEWQLGKLRECYHDMLVTMEKARAMSINGLLQ